MKRLSWLAFGLILALATAITHADSAPPSHWQPDIAAFVAADHEHPPARHGVLFIGSSSIRFWESLAQDFPGIPVINRGFGGSALPDSTYYADRIVWPYKPNLIVMYAGDNDINDGATPEQVIPAWDTGLVGQTVGSRVMLVVPPKDGYGKAGASSVGIKGTDTLVFVVDILDAMTLQSG